MPRNRLQGNYKLPYRDASLEMVPVVDWENWDRLLSRSRQTNIFMTADYLKSASRDFTSYFILIEDKVIGGYIDFTDLNSAEEIINFATYQNYFFCHNLQSTSAINFEIEVMYTITRLLIQSNYKFHLSLHHSLTDVRSFEWLNFDLKQEAIRIDVRYTGIIDLRNNNYESYFHLLKSSRKTESEKAEEYLTMRIGTTSDIPYFLEIYTAMFRNQSVIISDAKKQTIESIIQFALKNNRGKLYIAEDIATQVPVAGVFIQKDHVNAYYQFASSNELGRKLHAPTFLMLHSIKDAFESKINFFDVVGMNSPKRAFFKSSFGATPTPYFEISNA